MEQYNFDALEGMELKVFERLKGPDESGMMVSERTGSKHVHQAYAGYPRWESDTVGTEPVADVFTGRHDVPDVAVSPNRRSCSETYGGGAALYYEGDISDADCGSVEDREKDTGRDWCDSAFRNGYGAFPPDTDDPLPTVVFSDKKFSDEDIADMPVSANEEMPVSAFEVFADEGVPLVPPEIDRIVRVDSNELALMDRRMGEVSVLSMEICDPPIHSDTLDVRISHGDMEWLCLLYSASSGSAGANTVATRLDDKGLDHWRGVVWDLGIVGQQCLDVYYDCLCLIALFRDAMLSGY